MTAAELLHVSDHESRHELVRGELRTSTFSGAEHGSVAARIIASLDDHVRRHRLGTVYAAAGFHISKNPDTVRTSDVAFVRTERVIDTPEFFDGPPDVAIEIGDSEIEEKTLDWLRAGVQAVVIVDPRTRSARIHRSAGAATVADVIAIDDVIPGWRLSLAEIFD